MDGVHDLGGMDGFGPVDTDDDESFHEAWERKIFALTWTLILDDRFNLDEFRFGIERMDPVYYLEASYWEHWLAAVERLVVESGIAGLEELRDAADSAEDRPIDRSASTAETPHLAEVYEAEPDDDLDPAALAYAVGDEVSVGNLHPSGHTRCPGYVKNKTGVVEEIRGEYHVPDAYVEAQDMELEVVYSVRFDAADLWGDEHEGPDAVYVDLWERYLE